VHPVRELHERCQRLRLQPTFRVVQPRKDDADGANKGACVLVSASWFDQGACC
jgi:hypothetical protein